MKTSLLKIGLLGIVLISLNSFAQQVMNGSFETWGASNTYTLNDPQNWGTLNFDAVGLPQTSYESTASPFHGTKNVKMETMTGHGALGIDDTIGGAIFYNGDPFVSLASPYAGRPRSIAYNYKSNIVNSDTAWIFLALTKWNGSAQVTVGEALSYITSTTTSWTSENLQINYYSGQMPDSILFVAQSSAGSWPFYLSTYPAQPGTSLEMDAVTICDSIIASFTETVNGGTADFTETTSATGMESLLWDFGDGNTSTSSSPSHTYATNGSYPVSLTVTDSCGNDTTITNNVTISTIGLASLFKANSTVSIYPNPTSGLVNIDFAINDVQEISVVISDITGREITTLFHGETASEQLSFDTNNLNSGSYYIQIRSAEGGVIMKKLIIQ